MSKYVDDILKEFNQRGLETLNRIFKKGHCNCRSKGYTYFLMLEKSLQDILNRKTYGVSTTGRHTDQEKSL